jgi:2-keto-4-pentenoate hydratase/2-oxohepta-3-ene-1,7-dioic acid hydratase in catechol pathway
MKILRFKDTDGLVRLGVVDDPVVTDSPPERARLIEGDLFSSWRVTDDTATVAKLLYPFVPGMILGIGSNYKAAFTATGRPMPEYPVVFFKLANTLQNPGDPIVLPRTMLRAETVKYEGELCVVIGKGGKNIPASEAMEHVFGYTIANDVSGSDWQGERVGRQWAKGKGFDTFCPLGPAVVTADEIGDPTSLRVVTRVNAEVEQDESVAEMVFALPRLIEFLSAAHTIADGSIILTGTPPGARFVEPGEKIDVTIDGIGTLSNPVIEEA